MKKRYWLFGTLIFITLVFVVLVRLMPDAPNVSQQGHHSQEIDSEFVETTTPAADEVFVRPPRNVVVDTNADLTDGSSLSITSVADEEYGEGEVTIDESRVALRQAMRADAPDGQYQVAYTVCIDGASCEDGEFTFAIDRSQDALFTDLTGQEQVTIRMQDIMFEPSLVKISPGTKVTWLHDDSEQHFVNTNAHPSHTYYIPQNSLAIDHGETYELSFDEPGVYPYHCSAHPQMIGSILVE